MISNNNLCTIRLSPLSSLHLDCADDTSLPSDLLELKKIFIEDWRAGWFRLAADKVSIESKANFRFWQDIAAHYLTSLCHLPAEVEFSPLLPPETEQLYEWILRAPPMKGGEYLTKDSLLLLWKALNDWVDLTSQKHGGIHQFLSNWAPKWQQVGRVCFHLAENKKNPAKPFAFLATYSTGFGTHGKLKHIPLKQALKQYSGDNNRQVLVKLLTPVHKASQVCLWVQNLLTTKELYQPLAWPAAKAYQLLSTIPQLEESGLSVRIPNWWKKRSRPQVTVTIDSSKQQGIGVSSILDFKVELALDNQQLSKKEIADLLANTEGLTFLRGQWVEVDRVKLQEALDHWELLQNRCHNGEISFIEGMRLLAGAPLDLDAQFNNQDKKHWVNIEPGKALSEILGRLRNPQIMSSNNLKGLKALLRPYQQEGVSWLSLISNLGLGACLADDMGLGKTLQVLSLLLMIRQNHDPNQSWKPSLLIVPASLLSNWKNEAEKFTPTLKLFMLHPSETKKESLHQTCQSIQDADLVITTYSMVARFEWLSQTAWNLIILDEAQAIKNPGAKQTQSIKKLSSSSRIALTGTPIENKLSDLWSLFDFLNPGLLGSANRFKNYIKEMESYPEQFESLRKLISPYLLRRMKTDPKIISDLPEKIETPALCYLTKEQAGHYACIVNDLKQTLEKIDPKDRRGAVLKTLLQLKQVCNHPCQYLGTEDYQPSQSGKFLRLREICEELASRQEKVLIFTQFREIIPSLEDYLAQIFQTRGLSLHGNTPVKERKELVRSFQEGSGPPFFILSLKAGGTGLTLTAASHVIHFDRWWNPAVENQATDRAFRIGQKKNVQVHTFITQGTIEERIDAIINSKKELASEILSAPGETHILNLPDEELLNLLSIDIDRAVKY